MIIRGVWSQVYQFSYPPTSVSAIASYYVCPSHPSLYTQVKAVGTAQAAQAMAWALFPYAILRMCSFKFNNSTNRVLETLKFNACKLQ